jgi:hypothetical protein
MAPEAGLDCCQPHPSGWHSSRSRACGPVDCGTRVRIRCQAILALNAPAIRSVGEAIWPRLLLREAYPSWASGESKVRSLLEEVLVRSVNPPGSTVPARG